MTTARNPLTPTVNGFLPGFLSAGQNIINVLRCFQAIIEERERTRCRRICSVQPNKERTRWRSASAALFFRIPYSQNPAIYDRIIAVVTHPGFYYVFTTFHVPGLPRFAAFCLFCDRFNNSTGKMQLGKLPQIGEEYGILGGFSFMIKVLFICHGNLTDR